MMNIIHLQNLPPKATSENVRDFFEGFHVVEGGVHITTSYDGSVFVSFNSEEDASAAVALDGRRIFGEPVHLSLCSEQDREDRLKKLEEEDQILTDCQEIEDHSGSHGERPERYEPNYGEQKLRSDIFAGQSKEAAAGHLRSALHDNYIQIRNISQRTKVADLLKFFKGIGPAIQRDAIVLMEAEDGTERNVAFMRIENRRAFEIALKMDESNVNGYMVQIMECTREDFESAKNFEDDFREACRERGAEIMENHPRRRSVSPVREEKAARGYGDREVYHLKNEGGRIFEYHLYVKMLPSYAVKADVAKLFNKCNPGFISVRPDKHNRGNNEALVVLPNEQCLKKALEKDNIWYEGVQLEVRQYSKRPMRSPGKSKALVKPYPDSRPFKPQRDEEYTTEPYPYVFLANLNDSVSPRDIRDLFGVLARSIPRDGITIRADERGNDEYVAFVKFDSQRDFLRAKDMWMKGLFLKGRKIYQTLCTTALIRNYKIDSAWEPKRQVRRFGDDLSWSRPDLYQQRSYQQRSEPERPMYWKSRSRSRSRSPVRSRRSESYDFRESWHRNTSRERPADFGEAARAVTELELKTSERKLAGARRDEPDFGEASRRNHDEEIRQGNTMIKAVASSSTADYYQRFQSQSPPRFRSRSRSLSRVSSFPADASWSPSLHSSLSPSPERSLRTRSRSPVRHQYQRSPPHRSHSFSRSHSPVHSRGAPLVPQEKNPYEHTAPVASSVPLEQNPYGSTVPISANVPQVQNPYGNIEPPPIALLQPPAPAAEAAEKPRFIRVSPMPSWANDIWLTQFFSDCDIKKTSVLIKYNAGKPVHAYLECMTNADVEKACQRNGTYVGTDRICVEPLGDIMK